MKYKVKKWGDGLGVLISKKSGYKIGDEIELPDKNNPNPTPFDKAWEGIIRNIAKEESEKAIDKARGY